MNQTRCAPQARPIVMQCPICKKSVSEEEPDRPRWFPFCSERCKLIDLGRWLGGKYQIPADEPSDTPDDADSPEAN